MRALICLFASIHMFTAWAQDTVTTAPAFIELGYGYSFNPDGPGRKDNLNQMYILGSSFFNKGVNGALRFGVPLNRYSGVAAQYDQSIYFQAADRILAYYETTYTELDFTVEAPPWSISNIQIGPYATYRFRNWSFDAELLFGKSTVKVPQLHIRGKKPDFNGFFIFVYRPSQKISVNSVNPSIGARYHFNSSYYWFARARMIVNLTDEEEFYYESLYPEIRYYEWHDPVYSFKMDDLYQLGIVTGIGFNLSGK